MYQNTRLTEKHVVDGVVFQRNAQYPHSHVVLVKGSDEGSWGVLSWHYSWVTAIAAAKRAAEHFPAVMAERVNGGKAGHGKESNQNGSIGETVVDIA